MQSLINIILAEKNFAKTAEKYFDTFTMYLSKESTIKKWLKTKPPMVDVLTYILRLRPHALTIYDVGYWVEKNAPYLIPTNCPNNSEYWEAIYNKHYIAIDNNFVAWNTSTQEINERNN